MPTNEGAVTWDSGAISADERASALGQRGRTLWMVGLSGSGKSTLSKALEAKLVRSGVAAFRLDGDNLRHGLNSDLGFTAEARTENLRRVAHVAALMAEAGLVVICALISPESHHRDYARSIHSQHELPFHEVFVDAPVDVCESRDPKGLYAQAKAGKISHFTGVTAPFEPPVHPDMHLRTDQMSQEQALSILWDFVQHDHG